MYWRITCQDRKEQFKLLILKVLSKWNQHIIVKLIGLLITTCTAKFL